MALKRLDEEFALKRSDKITDAFWNRLLSTLEARHQWIEAKAADFDAATEQLLTLGLERITEILLPAIEEIQELTTLGFLVASSATEHLLVDDATLMFVIPEGPQRDHWTPSPFVAITREGSPDDWAIGQTVSYNKEFGEFFVTVLTINGDPGPHSDWSLGALAGSTAATYSMLDEALAALESVTAGVALVVDKAEEVEDDRVAVELARDATLATKAAYDILWWGARATPPPTTGGGAAVVGSQYLDTSTTPNVVRVRDALGTWAATVSVSLGGVRREDYVAATGPTLNGPYSVGGGFTTGDVYRNGVLLDDGSQVTFTPGPAGTFTTTGTVNGDLIAFRGYLSSDAADFYTKTEADARYLELSDTGTKGRAIAATATLDAAQTALGLSTFAKAFVAYANVGAALTGLTFSAYVQANLIGKTTAAAFLAELAGAPLNSPPLTGVPTAPTAAPGTSTTQLATTAFVIAMRDALLNAAPGLLDTLDELANALGDDPNFAATMAAALAAKAPLNAPALVDPTATTQAVGDNSTKVATTAFVQQNAENRGECRLVKTGTNSVRLDRSNGRLLTINGVAQTIPGAGVALAGITNGATAALFIYAWMNGAAMTLEYSATGHATDATTGVEIKSGDATRTLVGMVGFYIFSGDVESVISYFNRRSISQQVAASGAGSALSTVGATFGTFQCNWSDEPVRATWQGTGVIIPAGTGLLRVARDNVAVAHGLSGTGYVFNATQSPFNYGGPGTPTEGFYIYYTAVQAVTGGGTVTVSNGVLTIETRG